ncbi:MAG: Rpp14/Pop5 family protein [Candidatus Nezhaarchaeota archaeon]|nr:Rpp14/Pop5 family protein [Candidatus Nezhaarchaeota archaeon]
MVKRIRWRYLVLHVHAPLDLEARDLERSLRGHIRMFLGVYGLSRCPFKLVAYDREGKIGIVRCPHDSVEALRAALAFLSDIGGVPSSLHVVKSSGTIKKARKVVEGYVEKLKSHWALLELGMKKPSQATEK